MLAEFQAYRRRNPYSISAARALDIGSSVVEARITEEGNGNNLTVLAFRINLRRLGTYHP